MKRYLVVMSIVLITGLIVSCVGEGCFGPEGPGEWGPMMHYGFGYGGMFMWILFLVVIGLLIYFIVKAQKTKGQMPTQHPVEAIKNKLMTCASIWEIEQLCKGQ